MTLLQVKGLTTPHLNHIDLCLDGAERVGITGPSGSGKSLLLRALADMDPYEGQVFLDEAASHSMAPSQWRQRVALLPAASAWWHDTVGPHFKGVEAALFKELGFPPEVRDWEIRRLSSGEKQRLALLRVLARQPAVLLLDEPTANLDEANTGRAEALIGDYADRHGAPVLWVSHDLGQLQRLCSRVYRMAAGRLRPMEPGQGEDA